MQTLLLMFWLIASIIIGFIVESIALEFFGEIISIFIGVVIGIFTLALPVRILQWRLEKKIKKIELPDNFVRSVEIQGSLFRNYIALSESTSQILIIDPQHNQYRLEDFSFIRDWNFSFKRNGADKIINAVLTLELNSHEFPIMHIKLPFEKAETLFSRFKLVIEK